VTLPPTSFTEALGVRLPIVAAPMAGGPSTPALVAAVGEAGGLGVLGGAYLTPDALRAQIREVRRLTAAAFGVNLLLSEPVAVDADEVGVALALLAPYAEELGVELPTGPPGTAADDLDALVEVVVAERVPLVSVAFGVPSPSAVAALRGSGALLAGTATTVAEARAVDAAGFDVVVVQGAEAGGHRGTFLHDPEDGLVGLMALVPQVRSAVGVPVVAAGGIVDGRGVAACLRLGAAAAQLGTAFLLCPEAGTSAPYRRAVAAAQETDTVITRAFSGRAARGIRNRVTEDLAGAALPPYPVMNALTRGLRKRAAELGRAEFLSLWAGQGVGAVRELPAAELVALLERETEDALRA
jgi:nitronate monooxygenase